MSERFDKLSNGSVGRLDSYQRGCSLEEHSEDIALLDLQIAEITSFVQTTQLLQHRKNSASEARPLFRKIFS